MRYLGAVSHGNASVIWRANHSAVGLAGHRKPQQLPAFVAENKKCKELLKRNRRNHEQIDRRNALGMIVNEGLPGLQRTARPGHHVDRNRRLGDPDAELEQFAMHLGGTPQRVLKAHSSDQVAHLLGDARAASPRPGCPPPISGKTLAMPAYHRFWLDDGYGIKDARTAPIEPNEQSAVDPTQTQLTTRGALLQIAPLPQSFATVTQSAQGVHDALKAGIGS